MFPLWHILDAGHFSLSAKHKTEENKMAENKYAGTQTEKNLLEAFAGESQARNKYTFLHP